MDEEDTIMSYLRQEAGDDADVIKGIGFDESLGNKIGVTIIATGFEHKDPFKPAAKPKEEKKAEEKIVLHLGMNAADEKKSYTQPALALEDKDPYAPTMVEEHNTAPAVIQPSQQYYHEQVPQPVAQQQPRVAQTNEEPVYRFELKSEAPEPIKPQPAQQPPQPNDTNTLTRAGSGFLSRPSNIYAEAKPEQQPAPAEVKAVQPPVTEQPELEMKLVMRDEVVEPAEAPRPVINTASTDDFAITDDVDDQKRRAQERIQKLRNLSFNMNTSDAGSTEFDSVPAYIRRNMELFGNTLTSVENFYSKYTVKPDENDKGQISSINTFLEGKKPD
jgi:cell division protein FtsZ